VIVGAGRALILLYHRIAASDADPFDLCVRPERFADHLRALQAIGRAVPLSELPRRLESSREGERFVAITFDDGYADNLHAGLPILTRFGVPATVFAAAGTIGDVRPFWWDELAAAVMGPSAPAGLTVEVGGSVRRFELGDAGERKAVYTELWRSLRVLPGPARRRVLDRLPGSSSRGAAAEDSRPLSRDELVRLASDPLIELGAHTVTHPVLSALSVVDQRREVLASKRFLEEVADRSVDAFSYPYGRRVDFGPDTTELVRESGFACACTNEPAAVDATSSPFELPRVMVWDRSGDELVEHLERTYLA
jgi:peptidoglycan/xylan/chitin deacetylase (PgdA/CDA1 family)